jgi:hypothetical protein
VSAARPVRSLPAILVVVALLVPTSCGGGSDDEPSGGGDAGIDTATATAPAEPPDQIVTVPETAPSVTVTAPAPAPTAPEAQPGGAGDEEGIQVPARFVLQPGGALTPDSAQVPAFLGAAVIVENRDDAAHRLEVGDRGAQLPAGRTTTLTLPGRAATELPVLIDGNQAATLRVVAEATP